MATFEEAIDPVLENEGGYSNNSLDPGGETKYGISKRAYPDLNIGFLTLEQAKDIYRKDYWLPVYDQIKTQFLATKIFDMAVNMGHSQAHRILQRSLAHCGKHVDVDGVFGPNTLSAVNGCAPIDLYDEIKAQCVMYYVSLGKPEFLNGWIRRAVK